MTGPAAVSDVDRLLSEMELRRSFVRKYDEYPDVEFKHVAPTRGDMLGLDQAIRRHNEQTTGAERLPIIEYAVAFTIGWEGMTEHALSGNGVAEPVEFDRHDKRLFRAWLADRAELWSPMFDAILDAAAARQSKLEAAGKKPAPG